MLPPAAEEPLRLRVQELAAEAASRTDIAEQTLKGAVTALEAVR
jgi:hypothetical protein